MAAPTHHDPVESYIDDAYLKLGAKGLTLRPTQIELSKKVARALLSGIPLAAEAPTGTGKTIAYIVGALAAKNNYAKGIPILVSTATKALQLQMASQDVPFLVEAGLLAAGSVVVAKGKANYLCIKEAADALVLLESIMDEPEVFVDEDTADLDYDDLKAIVNAFNSKTWDGDFDNYTSNRPKSYRQITVNTDTCTYKKCAAFKDCAYFQAKSKAVNSDIIISNHDLTLIDLTAEADDTPGGLAIPNYYVVFDEAHHLPDKAVSAGTLKTNLVYLRSNLPSFNGATRIIKDSGKFSAALSWKHSDASRIDIDKVIASVKEIEALLRLTPFKPDDFQVRFPRGVIPSDLTEALKRSEQLLFELSTAMESLIMAYKNFPEALAAQKNSKDLARRIISIKRMAKESAACFKLMCSENNIAKWIEITPRSISVVAAPYKPHETLKKILWDNNRAIGVAMLSATLRDVNGFDRFTAKCGMPLNANTHVVPHSFPYAESTLVIAGMRASPKSSERAAFRKELTVELPQAINDKEATLIIFSSISHCKEFQQVLNLKYAPGMVKVQGDSGIKVLIAAHKADIDAGKGSILAGVASLSEGLDLPGDYCTHVIITAIPFAVPSSPIEQEVADDLGSRYFMEHSLPDAQVKLTQMVGRLLRRETDRGTITVFDRRLASEGYGRKMLACLPPFKTIVESRKAAAAL